MPQPLFDLPPGYRSFTPSIDDVPRATDFFNLVEVSEWGEPDFDESEVVEEWENLDLEQQVVLVEDAAGELVASMTLHGKNGVSWEAFGYVHPDHQEKGLGTWIVRWSEERALDPESDARPGYRRTILNFTSTINGPAHQLLENLGYEVVRVFRRMRIDLGTRPEPVAWPPGFELRPFVRGRDERSYFQTIDLAFADHWTASPRTFESWSKSWLGERFDQDLFVQIVADETVVGVCAGQPMGEGGWIGYVGVLPNYRRRGLATLMMQESFGRFWDKGIRRIDLGVDSQNRQNAIDLYLGVGMRESQSYETHRKVLVEGLEWIGDE